MVMRVSLAGYAQAVAALSHAAGGSYRGPRVSPGVLAEAAAATEGLDTRAIRGGLRAAAGSASVDVMRGRAVPLIVHFLIELAAGVLSSLVVSKANDWFAQKDGADRVADEGEEACAAIEQVDCECTKATDNVQGRLQGELGGVLTRLHTLDPGRQRNAFDACVASGAAMIDSAGSCLEELLRSRDEAIGGCLDELICRVEAVCGSSEQSCGGGAAVAASATATASASAGPEPAPPAPEPAPTGPEPASPTPEPAPSVGPPVATAQTTEPQTAATTESAGQTAEGASSVESAPRTPESTAPAVSAEPAPATQPQSLPPGAAANATDQTVHGNSVAGGLTLSAAASLGATVDAEFAVPTLPSVDCMSSSGPGCIIGAAAAGIGEAVVDFVVNAGNKLVDSCECPPVEPPDCAPPPPEESPSPGEPPVEPEPEPAEPAAEQTPPEPEVPLDQVPEPEPPPKKLAGMAAQAAASQTPEPSESTTEPSDSPSEPAPPEPAAESAAAPAAGSSAQDSTGSAAQSSAQDQPDPMPRKAGAW